MIHLFSLALSCIAFGASCFNLARAMSERNVSAVKAWTVAIALSLACGSGDLLLFMATVSK